MNLILGVIVIAVCIVVLLAAVSAAWCVAAGILDRKEPR